MRKQADLMGVGCEELIDYRVRGVGLGVIKQAYSLEKAFRLTSAAPLWQNLVEQHLDEQGPGWGQIKKAYWLAGQLASKVSVIISAEELLTRHAQGEGWGEILQEYREGPGKPPWVAHGPPPWARRGRPPWANSYRP
jgi:hypothetical protein